MPTNAQTPSQLIQRLLGIFCLGILLIFSSCTKNSKPEIWIYTSFYKEFLPEFEAELAKAFPEVKVNFYQGGSEIVASKMNAELLGGKTKADILMTADFNFYDELKKAGKLLKYESPSASRIPKEFNDPDGFYTCGRIGVMVIGYNSEAIPANEAPKSWKDLTSPKWKDKVSMGSPLDSGTNFALVSWLSDTFQWSYFEQLRAQGLMSAGGSSAVVNRIETKERPVGMLLLENVLKAWERGSPVRPVYPTDGGLIVPQPNAIMADTAQPEMAKKIYDWFLSEAAMKIIVKTGLYAPYEFEQPKNAAKFGSYKTALSRHGADRDMIKKKFSEIVLR